METRDGRGLRRGDSRAVAWVAGPSWLHGWRERMVVGQPRGRAHGRGYGGPVAAADRSELYLAEAVRGGRIVGCGGVGIGA